MALIIGVLLLAQPLAALAYTPLPVPQSNALGYGPLNTQGVTGPAFAHAIDQKLNGGDTIAPRLDSYTVGSLPTGASAQLYFALDGIPGSVPCSAGGTGAIALGINGLYACLPTAGQNIPTTTALLKGNGSGGIVAAVPGTNYAVPPSGTSIQKADGNGGFTAAIPGTAADYPAVNATYQGILNVASGGLLSTSTSTQAVTTASGSTTVAFNSSIGDFTVGHGIFIAHHGAAASVVAPTNFAGALRGYNTNPHPSATIDHAQCNVDSSNASCTTSYSAAVMAVDAKGGLSPATSVVTVANGPATLSTANSVYWSWSASTNAVSYIVVGCTGSSCTPTAIWGITPVTKFWDFGNHFGKDLTYGTSISTGVQATGANQDLSTTISSINGLNAVVATAPGISDATATVYHDNGPIVDAALTARASLGGEVLLPQPTTSSKYRFSQFNFENIANVVLEGNQRGSWSNSGTAVEFIGSAGSIPFYMNWAPGDVVTQLDVYASLSTPGIAWYVDADATTGTQRSKGDKILNNRLENDAGAVVTIGINSSGGENEFVRVEGNQLSAAHSLIGVLAYSGFQSDNTVIDNNLLPAANFCVWPTSAGTINERNNDGGGCTIFHYNDNYIKEWHIVGDYSDTNPSYWLYDNVGGGNAQQILIEGSSMGGAPGANGYGIQTLSDVTFANDTFNCAANGNNCLIGLNTSVGKRRATFVGGTYNAQYPAGLNAALKPPGGLPFTDSGGNNAKPFYAIVGGVQNVSGDIVTPDVIANGTALALDNNTPLQMVEGTAPSGIAGSDLLYADSTAHRPKWINNNGTATVPLLGSDVAGSTNNLQKNNGSGNLAAYGGSSCTGGQFVTGLDASGATTCAAASAGIVASSGASMLERYFGDGRDSTGPASGTMTAYEYFLTSWTCTGAITVANNKAVLIVHSQGAVNLNTGCTLILNNGGSGTHGMLGAASGGSGGGSGSGTVGNSTVDPSSHNIQAGGSFGTTGANGAAPTAVSSAVLAAWLRLIIADNAMEQWPLAVLGSWIGSASGGLGPEGAIGLAGNNSGGAGGKAGGLLVIYAPTITIAANVPIDVSGQCGAPPTNNSTGAGSGGGPGSIWLIAQTITDNGALYYESPGCGGNNWNVSIQFKNGAGDYTGTGAFAHVATLSSGNPATITVDAGGANYTVAPSCLIKSTAGTTATCTCTISAGAVNACTPSGGDGAYPTPTQYTTAGLGGYSGVAPFAPQQILID